MEFMTAKSVLHDALQESFITALLITGSVNRAEAAVLESISWLHPDDASGEALLWRAVEASLPSRGEAMEPRQEELEAALSILPSELQCVLYLAADLRYCFVCRVLVDLPREVCASLLHLQLRQLDERTCTALRRLVDIADNKAVARRSVHKEYSGATGLGVLSEPGQWQ
jgi:hypothetical protein